MPSSVILSPLIARISGTMSHPNSALVLRYTGVGKAALITPKSRGGKETKTKIWRLTQWIWNYLDTMWSNLPQSDRNLWTRHAHNSKAGPRSGFGYFRSVNIMRLLFWYPPIPRPPNTCDSIKQMAVQSAEFPGLYPGITKSVWKSGWMYPKDDPIYFDPENPPEPLPPLPPPGIEEPADPPGPPFLPCFPLRDYYIYSTSGDRGYILPEGNIPTVLGNSYSFAMHPDCGYQTDELLVDRQLVPPVDVHTFTNVHYTHDIHATFKPLYSTSWRDDFDYNFISDLGPCWYHHPNSTNSTFPEGGSAKTYWDPLGPDIQSDIQYSYQRLKTRSNSIEVDWTGINTLSGPGNYKAYLLLSLLVLDTEDHSTRAWVTIIDSKGPHPSRISIWTYYNGRPTRIFARDVHDNLTGVWDFWCREYNPTFYHFGIKHDGYSYGSAEATIFYAGNTVGFAMRMESYSLPRPTGSVAIRYFSTEPVTWG